MVIFYLIYVLLYVWVMSGSDHNWYYVLYTEYHGCRNGF